jgi:hypothetical protein
LISSRAQGHEFNAEGFLFESHPLIKKQCRRYTSLKLAKAVNALSSTDYDLG